MPPSGAAGRIGDGGDGRWARECSERRPSQIEHDRSRSRRRGGRSPRRVSTPHAGQQQSGDGAAAQGKKSSFIRPRIVHTETIETRQNGLRLYHRLPSVAARGAGLAALD